MYERSRAAGYSALRRIDSPSLCGDSTEVLSEADQRALERVRKLLALATSPNVHEAASAAAHAQALIDRHRLSAILDCESSLSDEADPITDARDEPLERARKIRPWKSLLAIVLAEHNGCVAYTLEEGAQSALVLVGRAADRAAVATLWTALVKRIEWLSATHGAGRSRRWHDDFRVGAVDAIAQQLSGARPETNDHDGAALDANALAIVDRAYDARDAALRRFVESRLRLGEGRAIRVNPRAWARGREVAGEQAWLPSGRARIEE